MVAEIADADQPSEPRENSPHDKAGRVVAYAILIRSGSAAECALWNAVAWDVT
jgi:hypothetical protein